MKGLKHIFSSMALLTVSIYGSAATTTNCTYDTLHLQECGNITLSAVSAANNDCPVGTSLKRYTRYIDERFSSCSSAVDLLDKRYQTLADKRAYRIDYTDVQWYGDSTVPVSLLMYISMSCPHCKQVYKQLYDTLNMTPSLKKKVRLGIKYRSQTRYDKILRATASMGKQPFFLRRCADFSERIDDEAVKKIASMIALNFDTLIQKAESADNVLAIKSSIKESTDNEVEFTPAIFINKRRYHSTKSADWILDAVDFIAAEYKKERTPAGKH